MERDRSRRVNRRLRGLSATVASLLVVACGSNSSPTPHTENQNPATQTPNSQPTQEVLGAYSGPRLGLGWPIDRSIPERLTSGPHNFNAPIGADMSLPQYKDLVRNELDFSNMNVVDCTKNPQATMPFDTIASNSGEIIFEGGPYSIIQIRDNNGFVEQYTHLGDGMKFKVGNRVKQGDILDDTLKCTENDTGLHLDFSVFQIQEQNKLVPIDMQNFVFIDTNGGKTTNVEGSTNYNGGMMLPDGKVIVADAGMASNIIPPLSGNAVESLPPSQSAIDALTQEPSTDNPLEGAKEKILQLFAQTWNENISISYNSYDLTDTNPKDFDSTLSIQTTTPGINIWYNREKNNLLNGQTITPLLINMEIVAETTLNDDVYKNQATALRIVGDMEVNNISLKSGDLSSYLQNSDNLNKITWEGQANINYAQRFRAIEYKDGSQMATCGLKLCYDYQKTNAVNNWLLNPPSDPLPDFGTWEQAGINGLGFTVDLKIVDGRWALLPLVAGSGPENSPWQTNNGLNYSLPMDIETYCNSGYYSSCEIIQTNFK